MGDTNLSIGETDGKPNVVDISSGTYSSYAIKNDGTLWAWGKNALGQLGDGTTDDRHKPTKIGSDTLDSTKQIKTGDTERRVKAAQSQASCQFFLIRSYWSLTARA